MANDEANGSALSSLRFGLLTARDDQAPYTPSQEFGYLGCRVASGVQFSTRFLSVCLCV